MNDFAIYTFSFKRSNSSTGVKAIKSIKNTTKGDFMIGEIRLDRESYNGLSVEDACLKRISDEILSKAGTEFFTIDDICLLNCFTVNGYEKESHCDSDFRDFIIKYIDKSQKVYSNASGRKTEIIRNISANNIKEAFKAWRNDDVDFQRTHNYSPRKYQQTIIDQYVKMISSGKKNVLIHLSTRGGKSLVSLFCAKLNGSKNILVLTPFPSAMDSFRNEVVHHEAFRGYRFFDKTNITKNTLFNGEKNVVFLSWQMFDKDIEKERLTNMFSQLKFDTIIIDETHHTSSSERSLEILPKIPHTYEIHLSGTPYNDILSGRFNVDQTITLDFIDLMRYDKETGEVGFPNLSVKNVCNMQSLNDKLVSIKPDLFETDSQFSLQKAFETFERTYAFLSWLFDRKVPVHTKETDMRSIINGTTNKHIIMFVPSVKGCVYANKALKTIIENTDNPFLKKYKVMSVSSYEETDDEYKNMEMETKINKFEEDNEYTIVLTCQKLTTGVTLKKSDCILLMRSLASAETFIQILFRIMTPSKGKTSASLYNFDSEACYQVIKEHIMIKREEDQDSSKTQTHYIKELTDLISFEDCLDDDSFDFIKESAEDFLKNIKELPVSYNFAKLFTNTSFDKFTKDEIITLCGFKFNEAGINKIQIATGKGGNKVGKTYKNGNDRNIDEMDGDIQNQINEITKQVEAMFRNIDWTIILNNVKSFEELLAINPFENI